MKNKMKSLLASYIIGVGTVSSAESATIFSDPITNYPVFSLYTNDNPAVTMPQNNGGFIGIFTNLGVWAAPPGDQFVNLGSGGLGLHTTLAVPHTVTDRYGQIFVQVGKNPANTSWMRLLMSTNSAPVLPSIDTPTDAGAD